MATANTRSESSTSSPHSDLSAKAGDAMSRIGDVAKEVADEAKRSATTLASEAGERMKSFMGQQLGVGAGLAGHVAASARVAADDLDHHAPQLAGLVRDVSQRMDQFAQEIRGESVDQLVRRTTDFARQRPAVMFGAAAACGFFLFRLFKAGTPATTGSSRHAAGHRDGLGSVGYRPYSPSVSPQGPSHGA
jgi:ElaB/YqjD/DUF883 family membrane-anchored ribosome-binding protein